MAEAIPAEEDLTPEDRALLMRINDKKKKLKVRKRRGGRCHVGAL